MNNFNPASENKTYSDAMGMIMVGNDGNITSLPGSDWTQHWYGDEGILLAPSSRGTWVVDGGRASDTARQATLKVARNMQEPFHLVPASHSPSWCKRAEVQLWGLCSALNSKMMQPPGEYAYHGTSSTLMTSIMENGLNPRESDSDAQWEHIDSELDDWCKGKLFLTTDQGMAETYVHEKHPGSSVSIIRVPMSELQDMNHDSMGNGKDLYVAHTLNTEVLEVLIDNDWIPIMDYPLSVSIPTLA